MQYQEISAIKIATVIAAAAVATTEVTCAIVSKSGNLASPRQNHGLTAVAAVAVSPPHCGACSRGSDQTIRILLPSFRRSALRRPRVTFQQTLHPLYRVNATNTTDRAHAAVHFSPLYLLLRARSWPVCESKVTSRGIVRGCACSSYLNSRSQVQLRRSSGRCNN